MALARSIKQRLEAGRRSLSDGGDSRVAMASVMLLLFAAGTILNLASIPLSSGMSRNETLGELVVSDLAALVCIVIGVRWRRISPLGFQLLLVMGTLLISFGAYVASDGPYDSEMLYIWVALYAAYFFTRRQAICQLAFVGISYAAVLTLGQRSGQGVARWVITMGSLTVTAWLFGYLKELLDRRLAERERSQRELEASLSLQRATLESTADGILVVDGDGHIVSFNRRFKEMWRVPEEVLESGDDSRAIASARDQLVDPESFVRSVERRYGRSEAESRDVLRFKDGRVVERYSRPQRGLDGEVHGRVWSFRDITERERIRSRLRHLADHDPLTGLLNRRRFEEELADRIAHAARYGEGGAVLLLDIDNFKLVNDTLGHPTGDAVITSIAELLREQMRETDVLARLGGDELAVLLPHADGDQARLVAGKLVETVRSHRASLKEADLQVTASIGLALISRSGTQTAEDLMVEADIAVYEAKSAGRDRFVIYHGSREGVPEIERAASRS
jgi:diguanylate cyclase (GGDEF)-like protein/PAS domain S-box-containing protein